MRGPHGAVAGGSGAQPPSTDQARTARLAAAERGMRGPHGAVAGGSGAQPPSTNDSHRRRRARWK